jgi:putative membrane protein
LLSGALLFAKGLLIGVANIIPGVSGGTFALLLGIYERLIAAIKALGPGTLKRAARLLSLRPGARRDFGEEWRRVDGAFLCLLGCGALAAILVGSRAIKYLLSDWPEVTLAFFVGLILPSIAVPYARMERRRWTELFWGIDGALLVIAVALAGNASGGGERAGGYLVMAACGALAISAMILPGVSGSFLLLVLGQYTNVIDAINAVTGWARSLAGSGGGPFPGDALGLLACFAAGAAAGLAGFTHLLHWLLRRFHSQTMAFLVGLIVGSLWTLWPFKDYSASEKILACPNVLPTANAELALSLLGAAAGFVAALLTMLLGARRAAD